MQTFQQFVLNEGVYDQDIFKMIFMAGGPGSGKTFVGRSSVKGTGMVVSDTDQFIEAGLEKAGMSKNMDAMEGDEDKRREIIRQKAKAIGHRQFRQWVEKGRLGVLVDGTGAKYERIARMKKEAEDMGYDTSMIFVNTELDISLKRNHDRWEKQGGRKVPEEVVKKRWLDVQKNIGKYQRLFGNADFTVVDNNTYDNENLSKVWDQIHKFRRKPIKNPLALKWIKDQLAAKKRK
jgi:predicted ABC-type ATPase